MTATGSLDGIANREAWQDQALCAQVDIDPEIFYPTKTGPTPREAKQICADCPVATQCLEYALRNHERHGVWGGLSERERHKIRLPRTLSAQRHGNRTAYRAGCRCNPCKAIMSADNRRRYRDRGKGIA